MFRHAPAGIVLAVLMLAGPSSGRAQAVVDDVPPETRAAIARRAVSVWIEADPDILWARVRAKSHRPLLLTADPEGTLRRLVAERYPVYATADLTVRSHDTTKDAMAEEILTALDAHFAAATAGTDHPGDVK